MSSEEDVPAPSPSAAVVARRAGREAKSMREESGSDKDAEEPEEWDDDGEASSDEDESDEEARVSNAQRGRVRLHGVSQSSAGLEVDDDRRKSLGEKGWARRSVVVRGVEPSGAAVFEAGARGVFTARARKARPSGRRSCSSSQRAVKNTPV